MNFIKKIPGYISNLFADMATGFVWMFLKLSVCVYRFIKYVWYGLLWPFMFVAIMIKKYTLKTKEIDVEKLKKASQALYEKEKKKEAKQKPKFFFSSTTSSFL